ncbi:nuclear transport factor 2 family protein [Halobaculum halobium]|uniref:Nuclear transport factor 2 family protein n=1 Tax=Halobaculum halobium TaxID=3032281 RepID=A0ABD5TC73_9EURY|nr:nuclear transport factor 2 family protein [Halobaculum sp. SYNS20]
MTADATVRSYYDAVDAGEYDALADLLAPEFVHERPDRTLSGRESFVRFMREDRPRTDTAHRLDAVYVRTDDDDDASGGPDSGGETDTPAEVVVRGRLLDGDGADMFGFVDVFRLASGDAVERLTTYTN